LQWKNLGEWTKIQEDFLYRKKQSGFAVLYRLFIFCWGTKR